MHPVIIPNWEEELPPLSQLLPSSRQTYAKIQGSTMGTSWSIQAYMEPNLGASLPSQVQAELNQLELQLSHWREDSDLMQFNRRCGEWVALKTEFFELLYLAHYIAQQTEGAFNPALGHLLELWGLGPAKHRQFAPSPKEIQRCLASADWRQIQFRSDIQAAFHSQELHLDLSGIAKGYACEHVKKILTQHGINSFLIEVGGEFCAQGIKSDRNPWWVELEHVPGQHTKSERVALLNCALASSGQYLQQYHTQDKVHVAHTIDPRSGTPAVHDLVAVNVIHPNGSKADAYATALLVMGQKIGIQFADENQLAARLVNVSGQVVYSRRMQAMMD